MQAISLDSGEVNGPVVKHWQTYLAHFPGLAWNSAELPVGDYVLAQGVAVERKSAMDFSLLVMDGRVPELAARLLLDFDHPVLVVEGDFHAGRFHGDPQKLREALAHLALQAIPLIPSPGPGFTAELIFSLAQTLETPKPTPSLRHGRPFDPLNSRRFLLEGLPGVNEGMAKTLLQHFGSPAKVFAASAEALAQVPGISVEAAARMRRILEGA